MSKSLLSLSRSFFFSFAERYVTIAVQAGSMVALARLIDPEHYGVFAAASAVLLLVEMPIRVGLHDSLVTQKRFARRNVGAGTAAALLLGIAGSLIMAAAGLIIGEFADGPFAPAFAVYLCLAPIPLLQAISVAGRATLARHMRFGVLMRVNAGKAIVGAAVAIGFALEGWGALSLALGMLAEAIVLAGSILAILPRTLKPRFSEALAPLRWATPWTVINFFKNAGDSLVYLVVGAFLGAAPLGLLNRAWVVINLFDQLLTEAVGPVLLPYLSRMKRSGNSIREAYELKLRVLSVLSWPFFGLVAIFAEEVVLVALGDQWLEAVPLVRILAISGLGIPLGGLLMRFAMALDMVDELVWRHLTGQLFKLAAALVAAQYGLNWVAAAITLASFFRIAQLMPPLARRLGENFGAIVRALLPGAAITLVVIAVPLLAMAAGLETDSPLINLVIVGGLAAPTWALLLMVTRHPLARYAMALRQARTT